MSLWGTFRTNARYKKPSWFYMCSVLCFGMFILENSVNIQGIQDELMNLDVSNSEIKVLHKEAVFLLTKILLLHRHPMKVH